MQTYAESLEVINGERIAVEVEDSILEHAAVAVARKRVRVVSQILCCNGARQSSVFGAGQFLHLRENEAITVEPLGVLGVEVHETVEKDVGDGSHAPRKGVSTYYSQEKRTG